MEGPGQKSTASLSVLPTPVIQRVDPPSDLTEAQAELFVEIADSKPVDWFGPDTAPLLAAYCRAVDMERRLRFQVEAAMAEGDGKAIKVALDVQEKQARLAASLATKLRLTPQSRYTPKAANTANKNTGAGAKPWQTGT